MSIANPNYEPRNFTNPDYKPYVLPVDDEPSGSIEPELDIKAHREVITNAVRSAVESMPAGEWFYTRDLPPIRVDIGGTELATVSSASASQILRGWPWMDQRRPTKGSTRQWFNLGENSGQVADRKGMERKPVDRKSRKQMTSTAGLAEWLVPHLEQKGFMTCKEIEADCPIDASASGIRGRIYKLASSGLIAKGMRGKVRSYGPVDQSVVSAAPVVEVPAEPTAEQPMFTVAVFHNRAELTLADAANLISSIAGVQQ